MTRTRNATFSGTGKYDAITDTPSYTRVLKEIVQDLHLVYDVATGENGIAAADTMNHDGTALGGALLNRPLFDQTINVRMSPSDTDMLTIGTGSVTILAAPVLIPAGQHAYRFEVDTDASAPSMEIVIYDTAGAVESRLDMAFLPGGSFHHATALFPTAGVIRYITLKCPFSAGAWELYGWRAVAPAFNESQPSIQPTEIGNTLPVAAAATGVAIPVETFNDEIFLDNYPVPGWIPVNLNRAINALWEATTGAPVPGNVAITNVDESAGVPDSTNPTTSKFLCHGRAGLAAEPLVDWPMLTEAFGAVKGGGAVVNGTPATLGLTEWHAPFPVDVAASIGREAAVYFPDFPAGGVSGLKVQLLVCHAKGKVAWSVDWRGKVSASGGASAMKAFTQLGTTEYYVANFTFADGLDFTPDAVNDIQLSTQKVAGAFLFEEFAVLGWCWYFDP